MVGKMDRINSKKKPSSNKKNKKIKIYLIDDEELICQSFKNLINNYENYNVVGFSLTSQKALQEVKQKKPDLIFIDVKLKSENGIDLIKKIKIQNPNIKILILSGYINSTLVANALQAGASGYISKTNTIDIVKEAIECVLTTNKFYVPKMYDIDIKEIALNLKFYPRSYELTKREKDILKYIINEYSTKQIANKLGISEKTVRNHKSNIMHKLNIENDVALIKYGLIMNKY